MIHYLLQMVIVFVATMCYAVLYHTPKKALVAVGLVAVGAWVAQSVITTYGFRPVGSAFFGGLFVAVASEALARRMHMPVIVFVVGGIVPLLPGSSAWATMREFVTGHYNEGVSRGTETFLIAAALSAGLVLAGTIVRLDRRRGTGARKTS